MVKLLRVITLLLCFTFPCTAQAISPPTMNLKVFQSSPLTFTWNYDLADEATITHFSLKWVDSLTGTFIELKQVPKTARSTTAPAGFSLGLKFMYYSVTAVDARVTTAPIESLPSNTVSTERIGKPPTNFGVN